MTELKDIELSTMVAELREKYAELFGGSPTLFRSPGRVNLIGEHTDYNHGLALPFAIDQHITMVFGQNSLGKEVSK